MNRITIFTATVVTATMFLFMSCGSRVSKNAANSEVEKLWTMLDGYWKYIPPTATDTDNPEFIFSFFGYDGNKKPISNTIWGYEGGENEYVTDVTKLDEHRYRVTFEVPANNEEGLFEMHDAYTIVYDYDMSDYANKKLKIISSGKKSEWEYVGATFPEYLFDE